VNRAETGDISINEKLEWLSYTFVKFTISMGQALDTMA
jgi:hypothetical protein